MGNVKISNIYDLKLVNKTNTDYPIELKLLTHNGVIQVIGNPVILKRQSIGESAFFIFLEKSSYHASDAIIKIGVYSKGKKLDEASATFVGPQK